MLASALSYGIGLSDSLMLAAAGEGEVGAISAGVQIQNLVTTVTLGFDAAILLLSARYLGGGKERAALSCSSLGAILSLGFGILCFFAFFFFPDLFVSLLSRERGVISIGGDYLRTVSISFPFFCTSGALAAILKSKKQVGSVFSASLFSLGLKILLNFLFIPEYSLGLGAHGAALSTVFARGGELAFLAVCFLYSVRDNLRRFLPTRSAVRAFLRYGTPLLLSQLVWAINLFYSTSVMGRYGAGLISALGIANTLNTLSAVVTSGIAGSAAILLSREVGSGKSDKIRLHTRSSEITFLLLGVTVGVVIFILHEPFVSLYSVGSEVSATALSLLRFLSLLAPVTGYQSAAMLGLIKSGGDVGFVLFSEAVSVFLIIIPLSLLAASLSVTPTLLYVSLKADGLPKCALAFRRLRSSSYPSSPDAEQSNT
jgi:putative MATE family efflux protein